MAHLDQNELAERWSLSPRTLEQWRWRGVGPRYRERGPMTDDEWAAKHSVETVDA